MRTTIILLLTLLFAGSQSTWAQMKPAKRYKSVYETATQTLTPESSPVDTYQPKEGDDYWFTLPRHGKDFIITEMIHSEQVNRSSIYKFDGNKHVYSSQKRASYD